MGEGRTDDFCLCWTKGIGVKTDRVVSCIVMPEVALPFGQLEFKLIIAVTHFTVGRQIKYILKDELHCLVSV